MKIRSLESYFYMLVGFYILLALVAIAIIGLMLSPWTLIVWPLFIGMCAVVISTIREEWRDPTFTKKL